MSERLPPIHAGEILREEFMAPLGLTAYRLAQDINVPVPRVNDIVRERRGISADTALRLARYFGTTAQFWLGLQMAHELERAEREHGAEIDDEVAPMQEAG